MRVIAHSLGADLSTLYVTTAGDFLVYPRSDKWCVIHGNVLAVADSRREAIDWIERTTKEEFV